MSTIHDALKKVENDMRPQNQEPEQKKPEQSRPHNPFNPPPPPPDPSAPVQNPEPPSKSNKKNFLIIILFILILCGLGFAATYALDHFNVFSKQKTISFSKKEPARPVVEENFIPGSRIRVKGTMVMGDKTVALINNNVYEVGNEINGKRIKSISPRTVILIGEDGEEEVLTVSK